MTAVAMRRTQTIRRLAQPAVILAVFLTFFPVWRLPNVFFTASDFVFCVSAVLLLAGGRICSRPFGPMTPIWIFSFTLMLLALFLSSMIRGDPIRWLIVSGQYTFAYFLLPYLLVSQDEDRAFLLAKVLVASLFCVEFFGAAVYYIYQGGWQEAQKFGPSFITGGRRLGSFIGQPNGNGVVISMILPFVLYLWFKARIRTMAAIAALVVLVWGLILSSSFTGFSSSALSVSTFLLLGGKMRAFLKAAPWLAACVIVIAASGYEPPDVFQRRVLQAVESGDLEQAGTYSYRKELMREAWEFSNRTLLTGLGADQYQHESAHDIAVHNIYLLIWVEGGLPALAGWLLLLGTYILIICLTYRRDRLAGALGFSVLLVFIIASIGATHMYARYVVTPLHLAMGLMLVACGHLGRPAKAESLASNRRALAERPAQPAMSE